ncbi:hypothetical protein MMC18_007332 [Xylographa bjoerkii]|nr:hypothetical protein [Xylographa bjoerkii]
MDSDVSSLLQQVESLGKLHLQKQSVASGPDVRRNLRAAVSKLSIALETPGDIIERVTYMPMNTVLMRIAIDLNVFKLLVEKNEPMSTNELAEVTGADRVLLGRILRCLAATDVLEEVDEETYVPTKIGKTFAGEFGIVNLKCLYYPLFTVLVTPAFSFSRREADSYVSPHHSFDCMEHAWHKLPEFLRENRYQEPTDPLDLPFQMAFDVKEPIFAWIYRHPAYFADFNTLMRLQRSGRANWLDYYPLEKEFEQCNAEKDSAMFLDIGGALGHEIEAIRSRYPKIPGRLILQDLPVNTDQVSKTDAMEPMAHDFFTPQPVKGNEDSRARIYYFRSIFHDYPDDKCGTILRHTAEAMKKGYSKLLINEFVIPNRGASSLMTHIDINMMSVLAAKERTEQQWYDLLEAAGLKIIKIWPMVEDSEAIVEAVLA